MLSARHSSLRSQGGSCPLKPLLRLSVAGHCVPSACCVSHGIVRVDRNRRAANPSPFVHTLSAYSASPSKASCGVQLPLEVDHHQPLLGVRPLYRVATAKAPPHALIQARMLCQLSEPGPRALLSVWADAAFRDCIHPNYFCESMLSLLHPGWEPLMNSSTPVGLRCVPGDP